MYLPLDVWHEILVRLPAECLIRARAVSKEFRAVIDNPCFVRVHTKNQQLSPSNVIITNKISRICYSLDLEALSCSSSSSSNGQQQTQISASPLDLSNTPTRPLSECDGLVLTTEERSFTIWNPLTHERLDLPPPAPDFSYSRSDFGLGYDAATDDYKAVVILRNQRATHVYSLKSDAWRRTTNYPPRDGPADFPGIFVCGALHWLSVGDEIIAMDLGTEKYSLLQMPNNNKPKSGMLLSVLGGCLALSLCDSDDFFRSHLDVWVMKVCGDEGSWIKSFSILHKWCGFLRPVTFIMKEEENFLVFLQDTCNKFFMFDVETKSLKRVGIIRGEDDSHPHTFWAAQQMFPRTIFRIHANCGGGKLLASTNKKKIKASDQLVFCMRDAKYKDRCGSCKFIF